MSVLLHSRALTFVRPWLVVAWLLACAGARAEFPSNPQSTAECNSANGAAKQESAQVWAQWKELYDQTNSIESQSFNACRGGRDYSRCRAPAEQQVRRIRSQMETISSRHTQMERQRQTRWMSCIERARAVERKHAEEKRAADERQRQAERSRREAEDQVRRQRDESARQQAAYDREREEARRKTEALQRRQAEELARANRQQPRQNEPRVIATVPPSYLDSRQPNTRIVQTPQTQALQRAEAEQQRKLQEQQTSEQEAAALRAIGKQLIGSGAGAAGGLLRQSDDTPTKSVGGQINYQGKRAGEEARKEFLDSAFNPNGDRSEQIDRAVKDTSRLSKAAERTPISNPVAGQVQRDALAGVGSNANRAAGDLDRAIRDFDRSQSAPPSQTGGRGGAGAGQAVPFRPLSGSGTEQPPPAKPLQTPKRVCLDQRTHSPGDCLLLLCATEKWRNHIDCTTEAK